MGKTIALFCTLHPASIEKKNRVLSLLNTSKAYYQSPESKCTTWSYFTPSHALSLPSDLVPNEEQNTIIAGLEIYTDPSALSIQTDSPGFKTFHAKIKAENLYLKDEDLVAWYSAGGFVSRGDTAGPFGAGVFVLTALHVCHEGQRDRFVNGLSEYAEWVKQNEPGFLTYSIMIRPKAPDEVLVFERCAGRDTFTNHVGSLEFRKAMRALRPYMKIPKGQEWTELDNAFVGNVLGGQEGSVSSKL